MLNLREPCEAMNPSRLNSTLQGFGGSIMIWGVFCGYESGVHALLGYNQMAMRYLDILADQVHTEMWHFYTDYAGHFLCTKIHRA
ncbi:hypothetical protein TNCV_698801 [Trichonephila clavipes]|nr:hypothetical protein TNCV_698801 [Trichonephila clavipes]